MNKRIIFTIIGLLVPILGPFEEFLWFREAPIGKVVNVELLSPEHL